VNLLLREVSWLRLKPGCSRLRYHGFLVSFSSIHVAQHLRPALSSLQIGKNLLFFRLLGLPENA
jgi:hypothetical protein